jgi:hypothetical protein
VEDQIHTYLQTLLYLALRSVFSLGHIAGHEVVAEPSVVVPAAGPSVVVAGPVVVVARAELRLAVAVLVHRSAEVDSAEIVVDIVASIEVGDFAGNSSTDCLRRNSIGKELQGLNSVIVSFIIIGSVN